MWLSFVPGRAKPSGLISASFDVGTVALSIQSSEPIVLGRFPPFLIDGGNETRKARYEPPEDVAKA